MYLSLYCVQIGIDVYNIEKRYSSGCFRYFCSSIPYAAVAACFFLARQTPTTLRDLTCQTSTRSESEQKPLRSHDTNRANADCGGQFLLLLCIGWYAVVQQVCSPRLPFGVLFGLGTALFCSFLFEPLCISLHPHWFHPGSTSLVHGCAILLWHAIDFHLGLENSSHVTGHCPSKHISFRNLGD